MMLVSLGIGATLAVALIVVVSLLTAGRAPSGGSAPTSALVGQRVRAFSMAGLDGGREAMPWGEGHPTVLIFFASWCYPCQQEMPKVVAYLRRHEAAPVAVLGIDANDERGAARAFVARDRLDFPVVVDPNGDVTSGTFRFQTLPETVFLTARGVVTGVHFGAISPEKLAAGIAALRAG